MPPIFFVLCSINDRIWNYFFFFCSFKSCTTTRTTNNTKMSHTDKGKLLKDFEQMAMRCRNGNLEVMQILLFALLILILCAGTRSKVIANSRSLVARRTYWTDARVHPSVGRSWCPFNRMCSCFSPCCTCRQGLAQVRTTAA